MSEIKAWKKSGLNGTRSLEICDTGVVLYQLSYQAIWELAMLWVRNISVEGEEYKWIYKISHIWTGECKIESLICISSINKDMLC